MSGDDDEVYDLADRGDDRPGLEDVDLEEDSSAGVEGAVLDPDADDEDEEDDDEDDLDDDEFDDLDGCPATPGHWGWCRWPVSSSSRRGCAGVMCRSCSPTSTPPSRGPSPVT